MRLIAIAGFAFAGWLALSALSESASAAQQPVRPDDTTRNAAPALHDSESRGRDASGVPERIPQRVQELGGRPLRHVGSWDDDLRGVPEHVQEIGDHPVRFLRARRHDVFERKDRTVRQVRELADAAGVPRVRLPAVRTDAPIVDGLVHDIADSRPGLDQGLLSSAQEQPAADDEAQASDEAASGAGTAARSGHSPHAPGPFAGDREQRHCHGCQGDQHGPGPVLPSGQDSPRSGGNGGHPFSPVADLRGGRYPAAPPAAETRTFHRTALTDLSAPGGPSVVPD
ncbi:hypothetical protein [Actinomadura sp. 3N407]|uniref:hypothetical protein n=1 Tax=Actinomadura sp. 3N407 TaxID=3457423 RepID=UPI003FCD76BB